jgi:hypothetical protein
VPQEIIDEVSAKMEEEELYLSKLEVAKKQEIKKELKNG